MSYDEDRIDDYTLALLYLVMHNGQNGATRAWKGFDWDTMDRLHQKGLISNPKGKARSVVVFEEGEKRAAKLFEEFFGTDAADDDQRDRPDEEPIDPLAGPRFERTWDPDDLEPLNITSHDLDTCELVMTSNDFGFGGFEVYLDRKERTIRILDREPTMDEDTPPAESDPEWVHEAYELFCTIIKDSEGRFEMLPNADAYTDKRDMSDFAASVSDTEFANRLANTLRGRKPFRRFRDTLAEDPSQFERWHAFKDARTKWRLEAWLAEHGFYPVTSDDT